MSEINLEDIWDESAAAWDSMIEGGMKMYRDAIRDPAILNALGDIKGKKVLDIACGEGDGSRLIARKGAFVTGLDISQKMLDLAKAKSDESIVYDKGSALDLPYDNESFDYVTCFSMMNLPDIKKVYSECNRVLKFNGKIIVNTVHPCFKANPTNFITTHPNTKSFGMFVSDYFRRDPWIVKSKTKEKLGIESRDFQTITYPYKISDYINELINADFKLCFIDEPYANISKENKSHKKLYFWAKHAARNLIICGKKTN